MRPLLFSLVNVSRYFELNAEDSLRKTNAKFEQRFRYIEKRRKEQDKTLEEMNRGWNGAKSI